MTKVTILGCGPAGLMAAEGVRQCGITPTILSRPVPSDIGGAQYLHTYIPEITNREPDGKVLFVKRGSSYTYAEKVYGRPHAKTSWHEFSSGMHGVWNMRSAYNLLWDRLCDNIDDTNITPGLMCELNKRAQVKGELVISTISLKHQCLLAGHQFDDQMVYISPDASEIEEHENKIIWNGHDDVGWYRQSNIFGFPSTEWPDDPRDRKTVKVRKPLKTNCTCYPNIVRLGRYGTYKKGVLIHSAYAGAVEVLARKLGRTVSRRRQSAV